MVLFNLIFTPRVNRKHLTGQSRLYFHAREFFLGHYFTPFKLSFQLRRARWSSRWYLVFSEEKIKYKEGYEMQKTIYKCNKYLNK